MNTNRLGYLFKGLAQFRGELDVGNLEHLRSRAQHERGFTLDLGDLDASDACLLQKARNNVRSEKHMLLVLNVPCMLMQSRVS